MEKLSTIYCMLQFFLMHWASKTTLGNPVVVETLGFLTYYHQFCYSSVLRYSKQLPEQDSEDYYFDNKMVYRSEIFSQGWLDKDKEKLLALKISTQKINKVTVWWVSSTEREIAAKFSSPCRQILLLLSPMLWFI